LPSAETLGTSAKPVIALIFSGAPKLFDVLARV